MAYLNNVGILFKKKKQMSLSWAIVVSAMPTQWTGSFFMDCSNVQRFCIYIEFFLKSIRKAFLQIIFNGFYDFDLSLPSHEVR